MGLSPTLSNKRVEERIKIKKMEIEKIKKIIEKEIELELSLTRNNPEEKEKRNIIIKTNYLKERIEHLRNKILFKIDNPNYIRKGLNP